MKDDAFEQAKRYLKAHRRKKCWYRVVTCLAAVVVFCTTYALILPAITMEKDQCEIPEHTHSETCFTQVTSISRRVPLCTLESLNIHHHIPECFDAEDNLICGYANYIVHHHESVCYDENGNLWCPLPEIETHEHSDSCYAELENTTKAEHAHTDECYTFERGKLICARHVHTDDCYTETSTVLCTEDHDHDESCYETQWKLTCDIDSDHQHTDDCYEQIKTLHCYLSTEPVEMGFEEEVGPELICEEPEIILHIHQPYLSPDDSGCYDEYGNLICDQIQVLKHQHTDACFETVEEPVDTVTLTCTLSEDENHTHTALCYGTWEMTCSLEEHTHSDACKSVTESVELSEEEQTQVNIVIAVIEDLPSSEEVEDTLTAYEATGDETGYEAYYITVKEKCQTAYGQYDALTDTQKDKVSNFEKVEDLSWLWSSTTLELTDENVASNDEETLPVFDVRDSYPGYETDQSQSPMTIDQSGKIWQFGYYSNTDGYSMFNSLYYEENDWRMTKNSSGGTNWDYGRYSLEYICPSNSADSVVTFVAPEEGTYTIDATTAKAHWASDGGANIAIYAGETRLWPSNEAWCYLAPDVATEVPAITVALHKGEALRFQTNCNGVASNDNVTWYPIVTYTSRDSENAGQLRDSLDGDWAYITDFQMKEDTSTDSGKYIRTGTSAWDENDAAGNDSTDLNSILRTFDTASYTIEFSTKLREAVAREDVGGIKQGRLYFEFVLPLSEEEARFQTDSMGWLSSSQNIKYEIVTAEVNLNGLPTECQVLRGSFTLVPTGSNEAAIGASINELTVVIQAMKMHNGETIQPLFTLWLQHNDVGAIYSTVDDRLPWSIVTGTDYDCPTADHYGSGELEEHGIEAQTITAPLITISARPMFNIELIGVNSNNTTVGTFDFNDADQSAINYGKGEVTGRMNGYGIILETRGKAGQGMRGMEFPDVNTPITFELKLSTEFQPENGTRTPDNEYLPLFWAGDSNIGMEQCGDRKAVTQNLEIYEIPAGEGTGYRNVQKLGTWTFEATGDPSVIKVTVKDFAFGPHFPYGGFGIQDTFYKYYNPQTVGDDWWEIDRAVFCVGRVFVVQPFYNQDGRYVCDKYDANGQFYTSIEDQNMSMYAESSQEPVEVTTQEVNDDDIRNQGQYLKRPGNIDGYVQYNKYQGQYFEPLSAGAYQNDSDWATAGSKVTLQIEMEHDDSEGEYLGVASDNFLKWDDEFFEPDLDGHNFSAGWLDGGNVLWGAKKDKTGWTDDEEMKRCTEDDLIYFTNLSELNNQGYVPVAVLFETRSVLKESSWNHLHYFINGTIKEDCQTEQVYMIVRNSYAWRKLDVASETLAYYNDTHPDAQKTSVGQLDNDDYNAYTQNCLITHVPNQANTGKYYENGGTELNGSYPKPFWYHDYNHTSNSGSAENPGSSAVSECAAVTKASYPDGVYQSGHGSYYYQDSCLVIGFTTSIEKQTAQFEQGSPGTSKTNYDMDQNQRTVDYQLNVRVERSTYTPDSSTGSALETVVYVEDTLPAELTYISGSARLSGSYTQDPLHQNSGTTTGGYAFESTAAAGVNTPNDEHPYLETVTYNADGTTTIRWMFPVKLDLNATYWTEPILFSCSIGTPGVEATDVKNGQEIDNTAKVWADGDDQRGFNPDFGNVDTFGITVSKTNAVSLSKISDLLVGEKWDDLGFTMNVGNNSSNPKNNTIIAETLPYNGLNRSTFHGDLNVKEFSAALVDGSGNLMNNNFQFYYTTDPQYAGKLGSDYQTYLEAYQASNAGATLLDWMNSVGGWTQLTFASATAGVNGMTLYGASNLPDDLATGTQITAIVAVGDLPANATMKMHVTLTLPNGEAGD